MVNRSVRIIAYINGLKFITVLRILSFSTLNLPLIKLPIDENDEIQWMDMDWLLPRFNETLKRRKRTHQQFQPTNTVSSKQTIQKVVEKQLVMK